MGAAVRLVGSGKYSEGKRGSKARKTIQRRGRKGRKRAERRAGLRWKESKSHWQEQTSSEQWIKVSGGWKRSSQLLLLFNEWRLLLGRKTGSWWASIYTFALGWLLGECRQGSPVPSSAPCSSCCCCCRHCQGTGGSAAPVPDAQDPTTPLPFTPLLHLPLRGREFNLIRNSFQKRTQHNCCHPHFQNNFCLLQKRFYLLAKAYTSFVSLSIFFIWYFAVV